MTSATRPTNALFGGALVAAGLMSTASAQRLVVSAEAPENYISLLTETCIPYMGYACYMLGYGGALLWGQEPGQPDVEPVVDSAVEGYVYSVDATPTEFAFRREPKPSGRPDDWEFFYRAYAEVTLIATAPAMIEYDIGSFFVDVGDVYVGNGGTGTVTLDAGDTVVVRGLANVAERTFFTFRIVGTPSCTLADVAVPYGFTDLSDVDLFLTAFLGGSPVADVVSPFGVIDLSDVDAFIEQFLAGCP